MPKVDMNAMPNLPDALRGAFGRVKLALSRLFKDGVG